MQLNRLIKLTIPVVGATALLISTSVNASDGEAVYNKVCKMCHASGMMGAPKTEDTAAWAELIAKGMDTLNNNSIKGFGTMPPKGGMQTLSDEDVKAAVSYMVEASQ